MSALGGTLLIIFAELCAVWLGFQMGCEFTMEKTRNKRGYWRRANDTEREAGTGAGR